MHVRKNDLVMIITGKDKGTKGKITAAFPKTGRVVVEGVNVVTKHQKARNQMQPGGIVHKELPIDASNVMLANDFLSRIYAQVVYQTVIGY